MHLHYLAVTSEFRRQGLGRELTGFAIKVANEYGADISLETEAESPAMKLYMSVTDQANLDSPWLRDRTDYVTMIKKHRS